MTFEQLRVFQAIVVTGTFRGAGVQCYKSQPAVSALIKNLEASLGHSLFDRSEYRPKLTEQGKALYQQTLVILKEINKLVSLATRMSDGQETEVRMTVNRTYPIKNLLGKLKVIGQSFPQTKLTLTSEAMGGAIERLAQGQAELALTYEKGMNPDCMEAFPITTIKVIPVAHPGYGPASRPGHNTAEDVRNDVQVIVSDSSTNTPKHSMDVIANVRQWRVTDLADKKDIILSGMGWGGLPEHLIAKELKSGELVRVDVAGFDDRSVNLSIIRRTDKPCGPVTEALWQAMKTMRHPT